MRRAARKFVLDASDVIQTDEGALETFQAPPAPQIEMESFICPVTYEIMRKPGVLACGHSLEVDSIMGILGSEFPDECPLCRFPINAQQPYVENLTLKSSIEEFLQKTQLASGTRAVKTTAVPAASVSASAHIRLETGIAMRTSLSSTNAVALAAWNSGDRGEESGNQDYIYVSSDEE